MDFYLTAKFFHVTFAVIWLGGAAVMLVLGIQAARKHDDADLVAIVLKVAYLGGRVYMPAGLLTFLTGLAAVWLGWGWNHLWVVLGLIGFALTFVLGATVLKPRSDKIEAEYRANGLTPELVQQCRALLRVAKFDTVVLYVIIADMVLKPAAGDYLTLGILAVILMAAVGFFLTPTRSALRATE